MQDNLLYNQLKQIALDNKYTKVQFDTLKKEQIADLLKKSVDDKDWSGGNEGFFTNLKAGIVQKLEEQEDKTDEQFIKDQLISGQRLALKNRFPKAETERMLLYGKKVVVIWLDGKPDWEAEE